GPVLQADGREVPGAASLWGPGGLRPGPGGASGADGRADDDLRERLESALTAALAAELAALESAGGDGVSAGTHGRYTMTCLTLGRAVRVDRSEEHTSELQSRFDLVCRLLLEKKKKESKNE